MKLTSIKIGQVIITPKMLLALIVAFFIIGIGIGATVASESKSMMALLFCSIISISIIVYTFLSAK